MAKFYAMQIRLGRITLDDVPERWRDAVREMLEEHLILAAGGGING